MVCITTCEWKREIAAIAAASASIAALNTTTVPLGFLLLLRQLFDCLCSELPLMLLATGCVGL